MRMLYLYDQEAYSKLYLYFLTLKTHAKIENESKCVYELLI